MEPWVIEKLRKKKRANVHPPRQLLSGGYEPVFFSARGILPFLGEYGHPARKGDTVVYWLQPEPNHTTLCISLGTGQLPKNVFWAAGICGDKNRNPYLQLQNCLQLLGDWPYALEDRYIGIRPSTLFQGTIEINLLKEGCKLEKYTVLWDYSSLSVEAQINIVTQLTKWHTSSKSPVTVWKSKGGATFFSYIDRNGIMDFVEGNYLQGKIWFIEGEHPLNLTTKILAHGPSLVNSNMTIYTIQQFSDMLEKYAKLMGDGEDET